MRPVNLCLFARQGHQTQISFGNWPWTVVADEMAEVVGATRVTASLYHDVESAGGKAGELLQRLADKGEIRINARAASRTDARQARLTQDTFDAAVMGVQLPRYGADAPFLDVVVPQNLCFEFRGHARGAFLSDRANVKGDVSGGAGSHDARIGLATGHRNDSANATAV